ncbi:MAG: excinuclease ABC subunit UvrA [Bdellovibrionales bacterium]
MKNIRLWGARQNNLKGIEVEVPLGSFTVICGPSGSGKSSLAFETLYAEGQRRYVESLSNYSKQFLNKAPKPDIEGIENIPPAIAIEQKNSVKSSRSTVGTTTEIVDYLRLLYEKAGQAFCPDHHIALTKDSPTDGADKVLAAFANERGFILAPVPAEGRLMLEKKLHAALLQDGILRIYLPAPVKASKSSKAAATKAASRSTTKKGTKRIQASDETTMLTAVDARLAGAAVTYGQEVLGQILELNDPQIVKKGLPKELFYIVIDRMVFSDSERGRLVDSLSQAFRTGLKYSSQVLSGQAVILTVDGKRLLVSEDLSCSICGYRFPALTSAFFSFNSPVGACSTCNGFGNILDLDEAKVVPNPALSLSQGAIAPFAMPSAIYDRRQLKAFCKKHHIDLHAPWKDLPKEEKLLIWNGTDDFYGVKGLFEYLDTKKYKMHVRVFISRFKSPFPCKECRGTRLKPQVQQVLVGGRPITSLGSMTIVELHEHMLALKLSPATMHVCQEPLRQIRDRLKFLRDVGVGYLTLDRSTKTLSGGEYQRLNLANQLGMGLSQTLYVLDEPTVGLHPRDSERLIHVLKQLREQGNTLVVVEHDNDVIRSATHVIEMGPGSGHLGGEVIFAGEEKDFLQSERSLTADYLRPSSKWVPPHEPRPTNMPDYKYVLRLTGSRGHNLQDVDLDIPLNRLVTITGVSGSGKSTLVSKTLYPALARKLGVEFTPNLPFDQLTGTELIKSVVLIDQSPIGKTARSNPLTYMKIFDSIRTLMAATPEAKAMGFDAGAFSLNVDGGRCPVCKGLGYETVDMLFMDDIEIKCDACEGKRYTAEILEVTYKHKNIAQMLDMTVGEAMDFFVAHPQIRKPLALLKEVGLDYLRLGQSANSLSGGESQRLKVARELAGASQKATLYILDEPTTGLHFREVHLLLKVLNRLVDTGNSVVLVEHNLEVIKFSDYVIDLGPEAGAEGGRIVAEGTPEQIMNSRQSHTGRFLKDYLARLTPATMTAPRSGKTSSSTTSRMEK